VSTWGWPLGQLHKQARVQLVHQPSEILLAQASGSRHLSAAGYRAVLRSAPLPPLQSLADLLASLANFSQQTGRLRNEEIK
jgi:hypothetical protein